MSVPLLDIRNLTVTLAEKSGAPTLRGLTLAMQPGEVHAIMGPNGAGKSTLALTLLGHPRYKVASGTVRFRGVDVLALPTSERAAMGLFLAFQHPLGITGVTIGTALRTALNAQRAARTELAISPKEFRLEASVHLARLHLPEDFLDRDLNVGLSGGEQKKAEVLQLLMLQPMLAILDETDSGLDVDALKTVAEGVNAFRCAQNGVLIITHYPRLLQFLKPDRVHVLMGGTIVHEGGPELAHEIEDQGYAQWKKPG